MYGHSLNPNAPVSYECRVCGRDHQADMGCPEVRFEPRRTEKRKYLPMWHYERGDQGWVQ
jgi:hypothetical protein